MIRFGRDFLRRVPVLPAFHHAGNGLAVLKKKPGNLLGFFPGAGPAAEAGLDFLMADTRSWNAPTYRVLVGLMDGENAEAIGTLLSAIPSVFCALILKFLGAP